MATFPETPLFGTFPNYIEEFRDRICMYSALPHSELVLTGKMLERLMADSLGGVYTSDNSLIDIKAGQVGIQLKSTMQGTNHVIWRRASVPDKSDKIVTSRTSSAARNRLGSELLANLNQSKFSSLERHECNTFKVFHVKFYHGDVVEVVECDMGHILFPTTSFYWEWSTPTRGSAVLYARHRVTHEPWFCWNGNSGNHFAIINEKAWLEDRAISINRYAFLKTRREDRLTLERFEELLAGA